MSEQIVMPTSTCTNLISRYRLHPSGSDLSRFLAVLYVVEYDGQRLQFPVVNRHRPGPAAGRLPAHPKSPIVEDTLHRLAAPGIVKSAASDDRTQCDGIS